MTARPTGTLARLVPLLRLHAWGLPTIIALGLFQSLTEGLGIWLFVPLLHGLIAGANGPPPGQWPLNALDRLFQSVDPDHRLAAIALSLFAVVLISALLAYVHGALFSWLNGDIAHHLRRGIFRQLLTVSFGFIERDRSGRLLNVLASDTWRTSDALKILVHMIITGGTVLVYIALLLLMSWRLTLLVAVAMLLVSGVVRLFTSGIRQLGERVTRLNSELAHRMVEGVDGMRIIRAFGREEYEQGRFDLASDHLRRALLRLGLIEGAVHPVHEVLVSGLLLLILFATAHGASDVPVFLVFVFVLYRLQPRVKDLEASRVQLIALGTSVAEVVSMIEPGDKAYVTSGTLPHGTLTGLVFERVSFRYEAEAEPALVNASFEIPAGQTTALVGPSGGGKSTIIKLILRFHDPTEGAITSNGRELADYELESWRGRIGLVSQDSYLFNASVRDNIAYGRLNARPDEIIEAARQADAHDFITRLPDRYDTTLGHRGIRLSGGQQQRIALARALIRNPEILILDEATNALDSISENWIQHTLETLSGHRTVIVIAHRLATIEHADQIIVLEKGTVRERGNLATLMAADGLFARLYHLQHRSPRLKAMPVR
ncbi:MAG TPA: ABC transporter ATP-binding protein [Vicinamibacterales bacterium]